MRAIQISGTADGGFLVERKFAGVTSERFIVNHKRECPVFRNGGFLGQPTWKKEAVAILQTERHKCAPPVEIVPELDHPLHSTLDITGYKGEQQMNTLRFDELKEANLARVGEFKNRLGRIAHAKSDGSDWTLAEWTNAMAGEAGEACNYSKKIRRGDYDDDLSVGIDLLLKEIADVVIYADLVASQTGRSLSAAIIQKFNEKSDEVGSKVKLYAAPYLPPVAISQADGEAAFHGDGEDAGLDRTTFSIVPNGSDFPKIVRE
jgi:hypothetical protein